jgi:hypothetical protein
MRVAEKSAITVKLELTVFDCASCGVVYGIPDEFVERRQRDGQAFYCPNGHRQSYAGQTEADTLRQQLERERERVAWYSSRFDQQQAENRDLANSNRALKAAKTRILKRVNAGVCPHCHRTFKQLAAHMTTKHPDAPTA